MQRFRPFLPNLDAKVSGETTPTRMWVLCLVAVLLGLIGGGAAVGLFKLIGLITHLVLLHNIGTSLPTLRHYHPAPTIIITAVAGALIVSLLAMWSPVIRGHGIPESLETILVRESRIAPRAAFAKPLSAAITIGTGGPFGAEGPIIVTAGSLGSLIGQFLDTSPMERRIMLATGAAAGMAGTFNAPIASIILALELVLFERSLRTVIPLTIACGIAASVHTMVFGSTPLFAIHQSLHVGLSHLPLFVIVGVAAGALAVLLNKGLFRAEAIFRGLPVKIFWWPIIGALGFSLIGLIVPRTLSMGYSAISDTLNGRFVVSALAVLFVGKLFSWWISLSSQTSGGTLAPMFLIGATMGSMLGHGIDSLAPGLHLVPAAFALVAMGATFGAATKAPFTGVVFAFEVTGQYHMVIPLMIGVAAAELVAQLFLSERMMTEKLSHRGFRVDFKAEVDPLRMRVAGQLMHGPLTVPADCTVREARTLLAHAGASAAAVVDASGTYIGMVRAQDLTPWRNQHVLALTAPIVRRVTTTHSDGPIVVGETQQRQPALPIRHISPLTPRDFLVNALVLLIDNEIDQAPVVADGRLVGMVARADITAERLRAHRDLEAVQPGWGRALTARMHVDRSTAGIAPDVLEPVASPAGLATPADSVVIDHALAGASAAVASGHSGGSDHDHDQRTAVGAGSDAPHRREPVGIGDQDYRRLLDFRVGLARYLQWSDVRIREAGMTPAQYQLLLAVRELGLATEAPSVRDLAELLSVAPHVLSDLVDVAAAAGLIKQTEDRLDPRITRLGLTPLGETCLAQLVALHAAAVEWHPPSLNG